MSDELMALRKRVYDQEREIASLRADAERYLWVRQAGAWETEIWLSMATPEQIDAAIDAARQK